MREIKFRAWDTYGERMVKVKRMDWIEGGINVFVPAPIIPMGEDAYTQSSIDDCLDDCVLMQYTGLKDKNGKEIYEGDIVRLTERYWDGSGPKANGGNSYAVGWIEFEDCCVAGETWGLVDYERFEPTLWNHDKEMEVVGNIYENPELLKGGE